VVLVEVEVEGEQQSTARVLSRRQITTYTQQVQPNNLVLIECYTRTVQAIR
jgi:hypothetical protein